MSGPIVIHGPSSDQDYDLDLGPVLLSDWFHDCKQSPTRVLRDSTASSTSSTDSCDQC